MAGLAVVEGGIVGVEGFGAVEGVADLGIAAPSACMAGGSLRAGAGRGCLSLSEHSGRNHGIRSENIHWFNGCSWGRFRNYFKIILCYERLE